MEVREAERRKEASSGHSRPRMRPQDSASGCHLSPWVAWAWVQLDDKVADTWGCRGVIFKILFESLAEELPMAFVDSKFSVFGGMQA